MARDNYSCQECGLASIGGKHLHVHHRKARKDGGTDSMLNLVTLCRPCHQTQHSNNDDLEYKTKTYRLDTEVMKAWDKLRKQFGSYNKALRVLLIDKPKQDKK